MLIFVEGIDKAGKSTFIDHLCQVTGISVYRKKLPELEVAEHHIYFKGLNYALVEVHNLFGFDLIVDRSFISDWVYTNKRQMEKGFSTWSAWESEQQRPEFASRASLIVYIHITQDIFEERIRALPDPYMNLEDYPRYVNLYEQYLGQTTLPVVKIAGNVAWDKQLNQLLIGLPNSISFNELRTKLIGHSS